MAHRLTDEAGVSRALAIGIRQTPAELAKGRFMRAPDGHDGPVSRGDAMASVQDFIADEFLGGADEPEEEENAEAEEAEEQEEAEEAETDGEPTDNADEAVKPIDPPVSWDKDAKELFAQLPPELQATVVEREAQRDKAIQSATTDAANAKRNAVAEANAMFADQQRQYASHLEQIASQLAPQRPDPALAAQDPGAYVQALAVFDYQNAQYQEMVQRADHAKSEATQRENLTRQHELQQDHTILSEKLGDDWTDNAKRKELLTSLEGVGAELGYPADLMGQANATDILALKAAADWKAKATLWDQHLSTKMKAVRAAGNAPRVAKPGTSSTGAERTARGRDAAWASVKSSRGKDGKASAAFLEGLGIDL